MKDTTRVSDLVVLPNNMEPGTEVVSDRDIKQMTDSMFAKVIQKRNPGKLTNRCNTP